MATLKYKSSSFSPMFELDVPGSGYNATIHTTLDQAIDELFRCHNLTDGRTTLCLKFDKSVKLGREASRSIARGLRAAAGTLRHN